MMKVAVVTVGRSDYGIYKPLLEELADSRELDVGLLVGGGHLSDAFGRTVTQIEADGYRIDARVEMLGDDDEPGDIADAMARGVLGFSAHFRRAAPDLLIVLGDRFEMASAALAALPFKIPIAHIHGGEVTYGAIDDALRHSITKLSHLHFTSTEQYRQRVIQLGEHPDRVIVSGAPALDRLRSFRPLTVAELSRQTGWAWPEGFVLATFHPVTLEYEHTDKHIGALLDALAETDVPSVFTMPNPDTYGRVIRSAIEGFVAERRHCRAFESLGVEGFWSAMSHASAMIGNSSAGLLEAPSFRLPVVNIGSRQAGRVRGTNVIDCVPTKPAISSALQRALGARFRQSLTGENPYSRASASRTIVNQIERTDPQSLLRKRFVDLGSDQSSSPDAETAIDE